MTPLGLVFNDLGEVYFSEGTFPQLGQPTILFLDLRVGLFSSSHSNIIIMIKPKERQIRREPSPSIVQLDRTNVFLPVSNLVWSSLAFFIFILGADVLV